MKVLRNILRDLVEKRLWPVAVALVAALIAVPIILGGGDAETDSASIAPVPATAGANSPAVTAKVASLDVAADDGAVVKRDGKTRDPFVQHHLPKPVDTTPSAPTTPQAPAGSSSGSAGSSPTGGTTATPTATTPKPTDTSDKPETDTYFVTLKFGEVGAEKTYKNVARLTPLPSADDPFFVFLGLKSDGKSAVFLVDSDAVPSGDGTCEPSKDDCEQVVLQKGDTELFEVQSGTAGVVQYELDFTDISTKPAATKASAAVAHARESAAGREYIRQLVADDPSALDDWSFNSKLGLLVATEPAVANVPPAVAEQAAGEPVENTATVLTVPAAPAP